MNRLLFAAIINLLFAAYAFGAGQCLQYETEKVTLSGVITERVFPGPPDYEDIKKGDRPETAWILHLDKPVCVVPRDPKDDIDEPESNVTDMHLIIYGGCKKYKTLPGQQVIVRGTLTHSISGHHRTRVLVEVEDIKRAALLRPYYDGDCMPSSEFKLGAVAVYDAEGKIKTLLGKAKKIELSTGEDDGGKYTLRRLFYKNMAVDIVSPSTRTPSGIHPGLTLEQAIGILGRKPRDGSNGFYIATCPENKDGQELNASIGMSLSFDARGVLVGVEIAADRP
jgi:hypothetical protein